LRIIRKNLRKWLARLGPKPKPPSGSQKADSSGLERLKRGIFAEFKKRGLADQRQALTEKWIGKKSIKDLTENELSALLATVRAMPLQS
jgi:hypothetical protein